MNNSIRLHIAKQTVHGKYSLIGHLSFSKHGECNI
jgi:hypothetical protein